MSDDLSEVIGLLKTGTYLVTRRDSGQFLLGEHVPDSDPELLLLDLCIQPYKGRDLLRLPEGQRTRQAVEIFSGVELHTADAAEQVAADEVTYQGKQFEVGLVEDWRENAGYWRVIATKVDGG